MKTRNLLAPAARVLCVVALGAIPVYAQHNGDIAVGRSGANQLKVRPDDPNGTPTFDPSVDVGLLTAIPDPPAPPTSFRATNPGFDANFAADPAFDYYPLADGATIRLVAVADMEPAFYVRYSTQYVYNVGDFITLGSSVLHRHPVYVVDATDPDFDAFRTLWYGTFIVRDVGSTQYADSPPFTLRFSIVACRVGDVNGDALVDFADIDPLVNVLTDVGSATQMERCAADANRSGYVTFADIDAFVALLGG